LSGNITNGIGQPVRRKEDFRLLTGRGSFADDVRLPEMVHAVIVRSPHAHTRIGSIEKEQRSRLRACSPCSPAGIMSPTGSRRSRTVQGS
jgi:xanthine dehydrogenase molybdopterin-binding subunit B